MRDRLTPKQEEFVRLVVEEGTTLVGAYRRTYPPRNGTRSRGAEQVAARRVAQRPLVKERMEQLREGLLASDPAEMRRRANAALGRILAGRLDPRYRRTAIDVLRYLDERECARTAAAWEAYHAAAAQITALDDVEASRRNHKRAAAVRPIAATQPTAIETPTVVDEGANELDNPPARHVHQEEERQSEIWEVVRERQQRHLRLRPPAALRGGPIIDVPDEKQIRAEKDEKPLIAPESESSGPFSRGVDGESVDRETPGKVPASQGIDAAEPRYEMVAIPGRFGKAAYQRVRMR
jgi:hypothetical protein